MPSPTFVSHFKLFIGLTLLSPHLLMGIYEIHGVFQINFFEVKNPCNKFALLYRLYVHSILSIVFFALNGCNHLIISRKLIKRNINLIQL